MWCKQKQSLTDGQMMDKVMPVCVGFALLMPQKFNNLLQVYIGITEFNFCKSIIFHIILFYNKEFLCHQYYEPELEFQGMYVSPEQHSY